MDWGEDSEDDCQSSSEFDRYIVAIKTAGSSDKPLVFVIYTRSEECVFRCGEVLSAIYL